MISSLHRVLRSLWFGCAMTAAAQSGDSRPNIVVILADDMGAGDLRSYNPQSRIDTVHLDALAAAGLKFTNAHSPSAVCSPTRYALLTGRYAWRTRMKEGVLDGFAPPLIERDRANLASLLAGAGYRTACFGKWHVGMQWTKKDGTPLQGDLALAPRRGFRSGEEVDFSRPITGGPTAIGFDYYLGIAGSLDMAPYAWIENDRCLVNETTFVAEDQSLFQNLSPGLSDTEFKMEDVLPTLRRRTVDYINAHGRRPAREPLFLYLALNSPHLPIVPSREFVGRSQAGPYGDFMLETDDYVGAVVAALRANGMLENTLLLVTSDNGGLWHTWNPVEADDLAGHKPGDRGRHAAQFQHHSNGLLRGTKADIYEGGHRVPLLAHWPAVIAAGAECATPLELTDLFATIAEIVRRPISSDTAPDSFSFAALLRDPRGGKFDRPFLVHHSLRGGFAIREGNWKLAEFRGSSGFSSPVKVEPEPAEAAGQLYDLAADPHETHNLFLAEPERVAHLARLLDRARATTSLRAMPR